MTVDGAREELKDCLEDYLQQKGIPLRKPFRCLNPAHEDRHPSMSYYREGRQVRCFSCGVRYDLFDLIGLDYNVEDFRAQLRLAADLLRPGLDWDGGGEGRAAERRGTVRCYPGLQWTEEEGQREQVDGAQVVELPLPDRERLDGQRGLVPADRTAELAALVAGADGDLSYFEGRGIAVESVRRFGLFQREGRAYFPLYRGSRCLGWCARAVGEGVEPRYKNSPGPLGLWNGDRLDRDGGGKNLYITEGVVDALLLEQSGRAAVALCGSQNAAKLLRRCREGASLFQTWRFVTCGDGDAAGRRMNQALRKGLEELGLPCAVLELEEGDVGDWYLSRRRELEDKLAALEQAPAVEYTATSAAAALDSFFEYRESRDREGLSTGFPALDRVLDGGLYPGLYVMGAISSLGKTSFALQMADYLAEHCRDVLYFSLEQSRFELMAKSLSRLSKVLAGPGGVGTFTVRELLSGDLSLPQRELLEEVREGYARGARGLFLREGVADIGTGRIREAVREHMDARGQAPVVFVDYLQILQPADPRASDKQNTDRAVVELKRLSRDYHIPVVAISSFNRENYRAAVSMESFKESGAVEYSADVLLGLQLRGAGSPNLDLNQAKAKDPRELELILLKNRNGVPYARLNLDYLIRYNLFDNMR